MLRVRVTCAGLSYGTPLAAATRRNDTSRAARPAPRAILSPQTLNPLECALSDQSRLPDASLKTTSTATEFAHNLSRVLDQLAAEGGELIIEHGSRRVAKLVASPGHQTALEVMADLYRTLSDGAAVSWESDARKRGPGTETIKRGMRVSSGS